jgi:hypothetical protein
LLIRQLRAWPRFHQFSSLLHNVGAEQLIAIEDLRAGKHNKIASPFYFNQNKPAFKTKNMAKKIITIFFIQKKKSNILAKTYCYTSSKNFYFVFIAK